LPGPRLRRFTLKGFRSYGRQEQALVLDGNLAAAWAPNSSGKTSLAEGMEFLLTGRCVRRSLVASSSDEFAEALRNAHLPAGDEAFVEAEFETTAGRRTVRRTLVADYGRRQECSTQLLIDGAPAPEAGLTACGIVLSDPPLEAPVLAQHTLA
jgi:recombinational DNA repair ATPase RecF